MNEDMAKLEEYKEKAEAIRRKRSRVQGKLDGAMDRLSKIGFDTVAEAKKEIKAAEKRKDKLIKDKDKLMSDFEEKYAGIL